jgi:hypothetical protein
MTLRPMYYIISDFRLATSFVIVTCLPSLGRHFLVFWGVFWGSGYCFLRRPPTCTGCPVFYISELAFG